MPLTFAPTGPEFCAEVGGVDFPRPIDPPTLAGIVAGMDRHAVCVFRNTGQADRNA